MTSTDNLLLIMNNNCNLDCIMCSYRRRIKKRENNVSLLFLQSFKFNRFKKVYISGGEPLLHPYFRNIVDVLIAKKISIRLSTNATLLNNRNIYLLKDIQNVSISLDGFEKTHDKIRGAKGSYKKAIKSIELIQKYYPKCNLSISITLLPENINEILSFINFLKEMKNLNIGVQPVIPYFSPKYFRVNNTKFFVEKMTNVFKELISRNDEKMDNVKEYYYLCIDYIKANFSPLSGCKAGQEIVTIFPDGFLSPCWALDRINLNLYKSFEDVFKSEKFIRLKEKVRKKECPGCLFYCFYFPQ